jgi:hypothetical protein
MALKARANPVELIDLEQLKAWSDKTDFEKGRHGGILKYQVVADFDLLDGSFKESFVLRRALICMYCLFSLILYAHFSLHRRAMTQLVTVYCSIALLCPHHHPPLIRPT